MTREAQKTAAAFKQAAREAIDRAFADGHAVTVKEGRQIVRLHPSGERQVIGELNQAYRAPKQLKFQVRKTL